MSAYYNLTPSELQQVNNVNRDSFEYEEVDDRLFD